MNAIPHLIAPPLRDTVRAGPFALAPRLSTAWLAQGDQDTAWHIDVASPRAPAVTIRVEGPVPTRAAPAHADDSPAVLRLRVDGAFLEARWRRLAVQGLCVSSQLHDALPMLVSGGLQVLWDQRSQYTESAMQAGLEALLSLLERGLVSNGNPPLASNSRKDMLFEQTLRIIEQCLEDPALKPAAIARQNGCSLRSLQMAFAEHGTTVTDEIRDRRLARCKAMLLDAPLEPIGRLAMRWGFNDASHFCRLFKASFGVSPRQYRRWRTRPSALTVPDRQAA